MKSPVRHLYVHIPFCPSKCGYCAFVTHIGSLKLLPAYVDAVIADGRRTAATHPGGSLATVYFGGGTPSLLPPEQVQRLLDAFAGAFGFERDAEITLEAHPATVDASRLAAYHAAGITRISFGGESMQAAELAASGRIGNGETVRAAVTSAREAGFETVALDLIYGLPGATATAWEATLDKVLALPLDHLSLYPLSIEPATVFARRQREGKLAVPDDDQVANMYHHACRRLGADGFAHYEIANWARPGHACRHNRAYWLNEEWYGLGVGAHAFVRPWRTERVRGVRHYLDLVAQGEEPIAHREEIGRATECSETVMLGLRLLEDGLDLERLRCEFGYDLRRERGEVIDALTGAGLVRHQGARIALAEHAVPVANEVFAAVM